MDASQLTQAIIRGIIAVVIVGGCVYAIATGQNVPTEMWALAGIVVGGLFGADAVIKYARSAKKS
jgi:hypothetical protein